MLLVMVKRAIEVVSTGIWKKYLYGINGSDSSQQTSSMRLTNGKLPSRIGVWYLCVAADAYPPYPITSILFRAFQVAPDLIIKTSRNWLRNIYGWHWQKQANELTVQRLLIWLSSQVSKTVVEWFMMVIVSKPNGFPSTNVRTSICSRCIEVINVTAIWMIIRTRKDVCSMM